MEIEVEVEAGVVKTRRWESLSGLQRDLVRRVVADQRRTHGREPVRIVLYRNGVVDAFRASLGEPAPQGFLMLERVEREGS